MNREQMIAWLTLEGYQACTGPQLDWIYQVNGRWAFKWADDFKDYNGYADYGSDNYSLDNSDGYSHAEMKKEYQATDGWPSYTSLATLIAVLERTP